jgi:hypothetical protein
VRATFGDSSESALDATTSIQNGEFQIAFDSPLEGCNLGANRVEPIALYVDVDGDGACDLATDEVFVTSATGGPSGPRNQLILSPSIDHCPPSGFYVSGQLDAVRRLCPDAGDCLPFCRPPNVGDPPGPACTAPPDAGVEDASIGPDAGNASDADVAP